MILFQRAADITCRGCSKDKTISQKQHMFE